MSEDATAPLLADASVEVDDVDAAHAAAQRLGYEIVHPLTDEPWGVRRFFVREPNGKGAQHPQSPLTEPVHPVDSDPIQNVVSQLADCRC
jgi:hypothetical protein